MRFRTPLLIAALSAWAGAAPAQDLQYDAAALDPTGAASTPKPKKAKKAQQQPQQTQAPAAAAKPKPGGDRQFGELEGWSPGKSPPKDKEQESGSPGGPRGPVSVTPGGNMSLGLPF